MAGTPAPQSAPPISALQSVFASTPETTTTTTTTSSPHAPHLEHLAKQIMHNLTHQHLWSDVRVHHYSPVVRSGRNNPDSTESSDGADGEKRRLLPRPMLSGLPPQRLYVHPDEQIALLQGQKDRGEAAGLGDVEPEREWVLPSHLREKWSLRRFGEVFDGICVDAPDGEEDEEEREEGEKSRNEWKTCKRLLLATLDDDSTVVYYIVHDGIVKPRQN